MLSSRQNRDRDGLDVLIGSECLQVPSVEAQSLPDPNTL